MPRQTEPSANNALGSLLQAMLPRSRVRSENTQTIVGHPGLRPDILITAPGHSPVVIEAEYMPAHNAESEAKSRLGLTVAANDRPIEAVIALRYPDGVADADDLRDALEDARLSYCVFTRPAQVLDRFPESGWLDGSVTDLADIVRLVSVPQHAVDAAATAMEQGIDRVAAILDEVDKSRSGVTVSIARLLGMTNVPQTRRMACAIIANAMVFHERLAGMREGIKSLRLVCGPDVSNPQSETLDAWSRILEINYWPIFAVGKDILGQLPSGHAARILQTLEYTAGEVTAAGVNNSHDLAGRVFQRLIADRKYPGNLLHAARLGGALARLAVAKMDGVDWSDPEAIGGLRVADFACGTGALLSAVYEQAAARHERAGGNPAKLHKPMMEEVLYGCDVMPSAIHITGSTLAGVEPLEDFGSSRLYTLPYGRQTGRTVAIGSLELLKSSAAMTLFNTTNPALRTGSAGEETAANVIADFPDEGFDLVIMNPPFTRATNHGGAHSDVVNPAFAAFNATPADQMAMGKRINDLGRGTCYHGNAGMASAFAALAHRKLKPGGVLALVLPLVAAAGLSWRGFRRMLASEYTDLAVLSIAADDINDMSFSADTGLGECLIIARKLKPAETPAQPAQFASLTRRPGGFLDASYMANSITEIDYVRRIEDGPYGGTPLVLGDGLTGEVIAAPCHSDGEIWGAVRLSDCSVSQTAYALSQSKLWLPGSLAHLELKTAPLGIVGKLGLVDRDITGAAPRGPFEKVAPSPTATYPALWNHDARNETLMVCQPDSQLQVSPNPPMDTDGRRENSGRGVRELQGRWPGAHWGR